MIKKYFIFAIAFCVNVAVAKSPSEPVGRRVGETWTYSGEDDNNKVINGKKEKNSNSVFYGGIKSSYSGHQGNLDGEKIGDNDLIGVGFGGGIKGNVIEEISIGMEGYLNYMLSEPEYVLHYDDDNEKEKETFRYKYGLSAEVNAIAGFNITEEFNIYALVGLFYSRRTLLYEHNYSYYSYRYSQNCSFKEEPTISPQFGLGVGYSIMDSLAIKLQYTAVRYAKKDRDEYDVKCKTSETGYDDVYSDRGNVYFQQDEGTASRVELTVNLLF
ncbi:MAG: hypothetical protein LBC92_05945 [Rickettsiales bacterium]|jgi:opacity protein-like surface antigen|nr:hypothetical protein [Rickettsiales bacterium]